MQKLFTQKDDIHYRLGALDTIRVYLLNVLIVLESGLTDNIARSDAIPASHRFPVIASKHSTFRIVF